LYEPQYEHLLVFAGSGAAQLMHLAIISWFIYEDDLPASPLMYHVLICQAGTRCVRASISLFAYAFKT
jgi:hypothetical protein